MNSKNRRDVQRLRPSWRGWLTKRERLRCNAAWRARKRWHREHRTQWPRNVAAPLEYYWKARYCRRNSIYACGRTENGRSGKTTDVPREAPAVHSVPRTGF